MLENPLLTPRKLTLEDRLLRRLPFAEMLDRVDRRITQWMARYGLTMMRVALGIIFFWFGALKLVPGLSPAEELVRNTIFFIDPRLFQPVLAIWEMAIGLGLMTGLFMRATLLLLFLQMPGTVLPIFVTPAAVFTYFPFGLTIEGQYIVKNLALITAAIVLGSTVRGGRIVA
ncbi:MAG TPA: DoxX family membrane protein [Chloroflexi bacterium]|nr:DoxX family membrane protein [Chloroflexota bacterium]